MPWAEGSECRNADSIAAHVDFKVRTMNMSIYITKVAQRELRKESWKEAQRKSICVNLSPQWLHGELQLSTRCTLNCTAGKYLAAWTRWMSVTSPQCIPLPPGGSSVLGRWRYQLSVWSLPFTLSISLLTAPLNISQLEILKNRQTAHHQLKTHSRITENTAFILWNSIYSPWSNYLSSMKWAKKWVS